MLTKTMSTMMWLKYTYLDITYILNTLEPNGPYAMSLTLETEEHRWYSNLSTGTIKNFDG